MLIFPTLADATETYIRRWQMACVCSMLMGAWTKPHYPITMMGEHYARRWQN